MTQGISRNVVKVAISRMNNGKAVNGNGWDGEDGIDMLWDMMQIMSR